MKWLLINNGSINERIDINCVEYDIVEYRNYTTDQDYHDWTKLLFQEIPYDGIIMPLSSDKSKPNVDSLLFGLHLRLNYNLSKNIRCTPIVFISHFEIDTILNKFSYEVDNNAQCLLMTKGVYVSDIDDIDKTISHSCRPNDDDYRKILKQLNIHRKETSGLHDIANSWGCYKLSRVVGCDSEVLKNDKISSQLKELYAKFLICQNDIDNPQEEYPVVKPKCSGKRILYIDDKANEGWAVLMKNIFSEAGEGFQYVDSAKYKAADFNYEGFLSECKSHISEMWDLIIIDLRLNPAKEDIDNSSIPPTEFSGYKLAESFLINNEGNQIIVLTASNKVWNIQALIERGVSAYYIKESPEQNLTLDETYAHYNGLVNSINKCFKNTFLRDSFLKLEKIVNLSYKFSYPDENDPDKFGENTYANYEVSFELLKKALKSEENEEANKYKAYAYLQLFLIIEDFARHPSIYSYSNGNTYISYKGVMSYHISTKSGNDYELALRYHPKFYISGECVATDYYKKERVISVQKPKYDINYKISALLLFVFGRETSDDLNWTYLRDKRNDVAHANEGACFTNDDYDDLLDFLLFILDERNTMPVDVSYSLS